MPNNNVHASSFSGTDSLSDTLFKYVRTLPNHSRILSRLTAAKSSSAWDTSLTRCSTASLDPTCECEALPAPSAIAAINTSWSRTRTRTIRQSSWHGSPAASCDDPITEAETDAHMLH